MFVLYRVSNQYICPVFKWGTTEEWEFGLQRVMNFPVSRKLSERTYLLKVQKRSGHEVVSVQMAKLFNYSAKLFLDTCWMSKST